MIQANLTHAEAQARARAVTVSEYDLHIDVSSAGDATVETFPVTATLHLRTAEPALFIDYLGEGVDEVLLNGNVHGFDFTDGRIYVDSLPVGEALTITVSGRSRYSRTGQGMHRMFDRADGTCYLYSHLEPSDARRIFPCLDQPDMKAIFRTTMTAPASWTVLSNQAEVSRETFEIGEASNSAGDPESATATVTFADTPLLSTYLTSFAAGPYVSTERTWSSPDESLTVKLRAFARASMAEYVDDEILEVTAQGMDFFHEAFGFPYPWGKYDSIFVPEYNLGAMENPGLVTFTETYLFRSHATRAQHAGRANTILHEMSHMWFGDLVTPRWWDDLWLKESFAEFMGTDSEVEATRFTEAWTNFAGQRKNWAYLQDQLPTTHPIKAEIPDVDAARQNFDGITYAKGAAVLKQLVHYVGRKNFYAGARDYFNTHAFAAATFEDLLEALRRHTDRDLDAWAAAWLRTWGPDTLIPHLRVDNDTLTEIAVEATAADSTRPHRLDITLFDAELSPITTLDVDLPAEEGRTIIEQAAGLPAPALVVLNDGDHTYAKVRFDSESLATVRNRLSDIPDELTRAVIWTALWNLVRDGEWPVVEYVETVLAHAPAESNPSLVTTAFANAQFAVNHYLVDTNRESARQRIAKRIWQLLHDAAPGSDAQLLLARAAIGALAAAPGQEGIDKLRSLLDGACRGLRLDPDVRWSILAALAARDAVSIDELEAERQADNTLTGATAQLGAAHAFPTEAAKREIFDLVRTPGAYSNSEVDALLSAYNAPRSAALTEPLDEAFFANLTEMWDQHPIEIANRLVRGLYPERRASDAATDAYLAGGEVPGALRRVLLECQDHLRRTLRVQRMQVAQQQD